MEVSLYFTTKYKSLEAGDMPVCWCIGNFGISEFFWFKDVVLSCLVCVLSLSWTIKCISDFAEN